MRRIALLLGLAACNQRDPREAVKAAPPPPPAPAVVHESPPDAAPIAVAAPPDAAPPAPPAPRQRDPKEEARLEAEARAYADLLTSDDATVGVGDLGDRKRPGSDLDQQIADVRDSGVVVAVGGRGSRGDSSIHIGNAGPQEPPPQGRISVVDKQELDDTTLTSDLALRKIMSAYMAGMKRCYSSLLARDPTARGTVALQLAVNETGRVTRADATGFDDDLRGCIQQAMTSWRFPVPKDKDGEPTEAELKFGFRFTP